MAVLTGSGDADGLRPSSSPPSYVATAYGDREGCIAAQEPGALAESVQVSEVQESGDGDRDRGPERRPLRRGRRSRSSWSPTSDGAGWSTRCSRTSRQARERRRGTYSIVARDPAHRRARGRGAVALVLGRLDRHLGAGGGRRGRDPVDRRARLRRRACSTGSRAGEAPADALAAELAGDELGALPAGRGRRRRPARRRAHRRRLHRPRRGPRRATGSAPRRT